MKSLLVLCCVSFAITAMVIGGGREPTNDPASWTPICIPGRQKAPEFEDVAEWINSEPRTMKDLKGKVIVVHFMAFG